MALTSYITAMATANVQSVIVSASDRLGSQHLCAAAVEQPFQRSRVVWRNRPGRSVLAASEQT